MSDGDKLERTKTDVGKWLLAALSAAIVFFVIGYGLIQQSSYSQSAANRSADYAKDAAAQINQSCTGLAKLEEPVCLEKAATEYRLQARDKQREYDDLAAQQTSALWTGIMGVAALIGMGLSAIGVGLVYITFRETQRTAKVAEENLSAYREAERGHCEIQLMHGEKSKTSDLIHYTAQLSNAGRSPIKIVEIRYQSLTNPVAIDHFRGATSEEFSIAAGDKSNPSPLIRGFQNIERYPYIGGYVSYRCKFGGMHRTYFCYSVHVVDRGDMPVISFNSHWVQECKRERDWPADT